MNNTLLNTLNADQRRTVANVRAAAVRIWARPLHRYSDPKQVVKLAELGYTPHRMLTRMVGVVRSEHGRPGGFEHLHRHGA
jgi:hypothetical protein